MSSIPSGKPNPAPPIGDVCRQLGVTEQTFYAWKKKHAHLGGE
ncbi:transposase [Nitrospira japonica]